MTTSDDDEEEFQGDCVTITRGGQVTHLCMTTPIPSMEMFPYLLGELARRSRHTHKCLIWSPYTRPNPKKVRWD